MASQKVKGNIDKKKKPTDYSGASASENKIEKMTKLLDNLTAEMSKLKDQGHLPVRDKGPSEVRSSKPKFWSL